MGIKLTLETIAGGSIEACLEEAAAVAARVGCWVEINVNGIIVMIHPADRASVLHANYLKAVERGADFVSANAIPHGRLALKETNDGRL